MSEVKLARVVLVDDDPFIRSTIESALKSSGFDATAFGNARECLAALSVVKPEIALLDLDLGLGPTGIDLAHAIRKFDQSVGIIFLTTYQDPRFADGRNQLLPQGSRYLVKSEIENMAQLISVILQTKHRPYNQNINQMNKFVDLTDLQVEIWKAVSDGYSSAEIAEQRGISEKAVEATLSRIYGYLHIKKDKIHNPRVLLVNAFKTMSGKV
jgi:DNA-binding NarL/FixJ family response regulator